jgi:glycosyltransferase involved in cell wall biosynthesis
MNILYQTYGKVHSFKGGTERTTVTVATALTKQYGAKCFSIYEKPADTPKEKCFVKEFLWTQQKELERNIQELKGIILENRIDCVIVQGAFIHVPTFKAAVESTTCKVIFAHHFEPRWELVFGSFAETIKYNPSSFVDFARWIKNVIIYPWTALRKESQLSSAYLAAYESADNVVLLSRSFIKLYSEFARFSDTTKFVVIPNGLSFDEKYSFSSDIPKNKEVLIVARLDEPFKRLSLALRIWSRVKQDPIANEWTLRIVGHGKDLKLYEKIIHNEHIPDVFLEGRQDPIPYYKKASVFMMTSRSESWGLTLTEAQQMGVVPIAFDTYASLREIITDDENGVVIEESDIDSYVNRMKILMSDKKLRQQMAKQAIASSQRFSQERIAEMWWELLSK